MPMKTTFTIHVGFAMVCRLLFAYSYFSHKTVSTGKLYLDEGCELKFGFDRGNIGFVDGEPQFQYNSQKIVPFEKYARVIKVKNEFHQRDIASFQGTLQLSRASPSQSKRQILWKSLIRLTKVCMSAYKGNICILLILYTNSYCLQ